MKYLSYLLLLSVWLLAGFSSHLHAQKKTDEATKIYAFGYGTSFNDSIVYITEIQELSDASLEKGTNFLIDRSRYSAQLRQYLESRYWGHETTAIFFSEKKKKIDKKLAKVRREQGKKAGLRIVEIPLSEFQFQSLQKENK